VIYLDNNATTQPSAGVVAAMCDALQACWHNPSSIHRAGQIARQKVELARRDVAGLIGAKPRQIVFTSSGTESIDLVIRGLVDFKSKTVAKPVVITSLIEHGAVRELVHDLAQRGVIEARYLPIARGGFVDAGALPGLLGNAAEAGRVACVSVMWANNETGMVQPVETIGRYCRERGVTFHCDGTQWVGKMLVRVEAESDEATRRRGEAVVGGSGAAGVGGNGHVSTPTGQAGAATALGGVDCGNGGPLAPVPIDVLTFSPHKFYGPKGVGMVWIRRGVRLPPQIHGTQELGRRGGTENVPGIVGAGVACREAAAWLADPSLMDRQRALRDRFERDVLAAVGGSVANTPCDPACRVWNTASIAFPRLEAEALLMLLSEMGLCASAGSACSSGSLEPSPVLLAMGLPPEAAHGSIRFSLSRHTTDAEVDEAVRIVVAAVGRLRQSVASLVEARG